MIENTLNNHDNELDSCISMCIANINTYHVSHATIPTRNLWHAIDMFDKSHCMNLINRKAITSLWYSRCEQTRTRNLSETKIHLKREHIQTDYQSKGINKDFSKNREKEEKRGNVVVCID